jgi:hypothetical protein
VLLAQAHGVLSLVEYGLLLEVISINACNTAAETCLVLVGIAANRVASLLGGRLLALCTPSMLDTRIPPEKSLH